MNYVIKNPVFINTACNIVRITLQKENGISTIAEFKVPDNRERGVNEYWDFILDNFDIDKMVENRRDHEKHYKDQQKYLKQKTEAATEAYKLRDLFNLKIAVFNYPFVKEASSEDKTAIRRSQDTFILNMIVTRLAQEYMEKNNLTIIELLDAIDDTAEDEIDAS